MNKKQITILAIVLAVIIVVCVVAIILINNSNDQNPCDKHVDANGDGKCDVCGESIGSLPIDPEYQDKVEAQSRYNITVVEGEGFSVNAPKSLLKGETLVFTVEISNYFDGTNAVVKANDKVVAPDDDGNYKVKRISADITISVTGLSRVYYGVAKTYKGLGVKVVGDDKVAVGGDYTFTLQVSQHATEEVQVKVNGQIVTPNDGVYTVASCNDNVVIEVSDPAVPKVNATVDGVGYAIEAHPTVIGDTYYFSVHINQDYENHQPLVVKANGSVVEAVDGIYAVQNAPQDIAIAVEGLTLREKITISFANCDLEPVTVYKATMWQGAIPTREGYVFNGWTDLFGNPIDLDYMSDKTLYASWITDDGIDYISELADLQSKIVARSSALGSIWWKLNSSDAELSAEYNRLKGCLTEYEQTDFVESSSVTTYLQKAYYISSDIIGENSAIGTSGNAVSVTYLDGEQVVSHYSSSTLAVANGKELDGVNFNIQAKIGENQNVVVLDYAINFGKINFQELCQDGENKVTFWLSTNYEGMTVKLGEELLFNSAFTTTIVENGKTANRALYRVDIQNGYVYVNGIVKLAMPTDIYTGESEFVLDVTRLPNPTHEFAFINVSHIYLGANDPALRLPTEFKAVSGSIYGPATLQSNPSSTPDLEDKTGLEIYSYTASGWKNDSLADIDLMGYSEVKFYIKSLTNKGSIKQDCDGGETGTIVFLDDGAWKEITLIKNEAGTGFDIYVNGALKAIKFYTSSSKTTEIPLTNLKQLTLNQNSGQAFLISNLFVDEAHWVAPKEFTAGGKIYALGTLESNPSSTPDLEDKTGLEIYSYTASGWQNESFADVDLMAYDEVKFYVMSTTDNGSIKSDFDGGTQGHIEYLSDSWKEVHIVKNADGEGCTLYIDGIKIDHQFYESDKTTPKELTSLKQLTLNAGTNGGSFLISNLLVYTAPTV